MACGAAALFAPADAGAMVMQFGGDGPVVIDAAADRAADAPSQNATERAKFRALAEAVALRHAGADAVAGAGLDAVGFAALFTALVAQESGFDPRAVSPKGAMGLAQLMPGTAAALGVADPFDPEANLDGGARYLVRQLARFGDVRLALAAYNAGWRRVVEHGGVPPFTETRGYVAAVTRAAGLSDRAAAPAPIPTAHADTRSISVWQF